MDSRAVTNRRTFLRTALGAAVLVSLAPLRAAGSVAARFAHPDPRPDVDGSKVLSADALQPNFVELFDGIREIPHIADGIGCHCGCGAMPEMRSLLSCYEGIGMAQFCVICSGEGEMAVRLHAEGHSLQEIREAIDRRYG